MNLNLETLAAVIVVALVVSFVVVVWVTRDPRSRRVRIGVFLERDDWVNPDERDQDAP